MIVDAIGMRRAFDFVMVQVTVDAIEMRGCFVCMEGLNANVASARN